MPYATPARVIQEFGLEEVTQLLQDEQRLLTSTLLLDALAAVFAGTPSPAEQAAATAGVLRLNRKLETVSNMMDSYLRGAVALPLALDDANAGTLEECCVALVRCGLADDTDNATERMDKCCDQWRVWLKDVARGVVQLVSATGQPVPANSHSGTRSGQAVTGYDWGSFGSSVAGGRQWRAL
jgi:phage gp36-like protein